jgi:hypothetical protein
MAEVTVAWNLIELYRFINVAGHFSKNLVRHFHEIHA